MTNSKKSNLVGMAIIISMAIIALVVFQNLPSMSILGATEGIEYDYHYASFNEDYITVVSEVSSFPDTTATFQLYHESDQHYPQADIPFEKCGQGGAWADYLNEVCYYDIHKDQRIIFINGSCTMSTESGTYDATEIIFLNDQPNAIECTFPSATELNISNVQEVQYNLNVKLTFNPVCNQTAFDKESCINSWYIQPFKKGDYSVRYDSYGCENYICETEYQPQNIAIGVLVIALLIIILKIGRRFRAKRGA